MQFLIMVTSFDYRNLQIPISQRKKIHNLYQYNFSLVWNR
uniref:Uncharacterized protein n=1 Tax=Rhizophora mucronata TaxID=61149 RepID=A0A2P2NRM0_RHIMU